MSRKKLSPRRRMAGELLELRYCLSATAFASHEIECCSVFADRSQIEAADLDGDGDHDLLFASNGRLRSRPIIAWYENTDGSGAFSEQRTIATPLLQIGSIQAADLDGDGDLDVLAALLEDYEKTGNVVWYENTNGRGALSAPNFISAQGANAATAADIDGDGDLDVVVSGTSVYGEATDGIIWFENTSGHGDFGLQHVITTTASDSLEIADLDGDGDLDVVGTSNDFLSKGRVAWYENIGGQGSFAAPREFLQAASVRTVRAADLDGDGDLDLLASFTETGTFTPEVAWYENSNGSGDFSFKRTIAIQQFELRDVADLDGDGDLDIVTSSGEWLRNVDGQGKFETAGVFDIERGFAHVSSADLDGDGDLDVIGLMWPFPGTYHRSKLYWYKNDGHGSFIDRRLLSSAAEGVRSVSTADLDGDGDLDVVAPSSYNGIGWYENRNGKGELGEPRFITDSGQRATSAQAVDLDGDGDLDILAVDSSTLRWDSSIAWYENRNGKGDFGARKTISTKLDANFFIDSVLAADLDGDGDQDIVATDNKGNPNLSKVSWYENTDGNGTFSSRKAISSEIDAPYDRAADVADLDGDGDLDVVAIDRRSGRAIWFENTDGHGVFAGQKVIAPDQVATVRVSDLDGDGDLDLLVASANWFPDGGSVAWYENRDGLGTFGARRTISMDGTGIRDAADLDGDGDLDVLAASYQSGGSIVWYENSDGRGAFSSPKTIARQGASAIVAVDLNGDGDMDVIGWGGRNDGEMSWYEQRVIGDANGDGIFNSADFVHVFLAGEYEDRAVGNSSFDEGDWNGDGEFDSADFVLAFLAGHYVAEAQPDRPPAAEFAAAVDWLFNTDEDVHPRGHPASVELPWKLSGRRFLGSHRSSM